MQLLCRKTCRHLCSVTSGKSGAMDLKTFHNTVSVQIQSFSLDAGLLHSSLSQTLVYTIQLDNTHCSLGIYFLHQCLCEDSQLEITSLTPSAIPYLPKYSPLFKTQLRCHPFHEVFINPPDNMNFSPSFCVSQHFIWPVLLFSPHSLVLMSDCFTGLH